MSEEKEQPKRLSRKEFVKGAAVGAVGAAAAGALASCAPAATPAPAGTAEPCPTCPPAEECPPAAAAWMPESWDEEADVVVVGAGFAAQAAAITAHDAGVSVLMLEKAPEEFQGGNSRVCGQGFLSPSPAIWEDYYEYLEAATAGQGFPVNPDKDFSDETLRFYTEESAKNVEWFESLGATVIDDTVAFGGMIGSALWIPFYPQFPGADAIASEPGWYRVGGDYDGPGGNWYFLEDQILERGIKKLFESPAKRLVQDPVTREVLGVVAESGGQEIYVKAKRAVCVCAGGWEYNQQMVRDFQGIPVLYGIGSPYNTGESIKMCWAAGADIRNMSAIAAPCGWSAGVMPGYNAAQMVSLAPAAGGAIAIGANNKRWMNEYRTELYGGLGGLSYEERKELAGQEGTVSTTGQKIENGVFVRWDRPVPIHLIFDEEARLSGPLFGMMGMGWAAGVEGYVPSDDNSDELDAGWFVVADTIEELATKIGRDPAAVEDTINSWNQACAAGVDEEHGRTTNLTPIEGPPYYAIEAFPECLNTQGGMLRNIKSQVLDIEGEVIPRLYSAGENGDIWTIIYQCMSNVGGGCYAYGRVAGENAAAEEPWE